MQPGITVGPAAMTRPARADWDFRTVRAGSWAREDMSESVYALKTAGDRDGIAGEPADGLPINWRGSRCCHG
jgi:hypothetical protein